MGRKYKILVVPSDTYGVGLYRSRRPHEKLQELYGDEFEVQINMNPNWADFKWFEQFDLIHFHTCGSPPSRLTEYSKPPTFKKSSVDFVTT